MSVTIPTPVPTADLGQACADLDAAGFCIVIDALPADTVNEIRDRILEQAAAERRMDLDFDYPAEAEGDAVNQWVYQLLNKGEVFHQMPVHPIARALATHVLGREHLLSAIDTHITHPGNKAMPLHADQWWMPQPQLPGQSHQRAGDITRGDERFGGPAPAAHPITGSMAVNMMWTMTDFTVDNGATRFVAGSHLSGNLPDPAETYAEVQPEVPPGCVLAWDARSWHGAGLNTADAPRVGLTTYFCGPMMRQLANNVYGTKADVRDGLSPELAGLLGFTPFSSYGMTDDPNTDFVRSAEETAGELS